MKTIVYILLALIIFLSVTGMMLVHGRRGASAPAAGPSYVTFWLTFEEGDTTGAYDIDGTDDCSDGDTTGTYVSGATLTNATTISGNYYLSIPTTYDSMDFAITSGDIAPYNEGRIGFWVRANTSWPTGAAGDAVIVLQLDGNNYFRVRFSASGEFNAQWYAGGVNESYPNTGSLLAGAADTNYFVEVGWDVMNNYVTIWVDNAQLGHSTSAITQIAWTLLSVGGKLTASGFGVDNLIIGNSYSQSLYGLRNETAPTCNGTGALCND